MISLKTKKIESISTLLTPGELISKYLAEAKTMQLATVHDGRPWSCNLHFVGDKKGNIYWLSLPTRRHSEDIAGNENVAISIAIKTSMPVVGIQAEGTAEQVAELNVVKRVMIDYVRRHGTGKAFYDRALHGISQHRLYKFTPMRISLFDEVNFPKDSPHQWVVGDK